MGRRNAAGVAAATDPRRRYRNRSDSAESHSSDTNEIQINLACPGAETVNIFRASNGGVVFKGEAPQADQLAAVARQYQVRLITLSPLAWRDRWRQPGPSVRRRKAGSPWRVRRQLGRLLEQQGVLVVDLREVVDRDDVLRSLSLPAGAALRAPRSRVRHAGQAGAEHRRAGCGAQGLEAHPPADLELFRLSSRTC